MAAAKLRNELTDTATAERAAALLTPPEGDGKYRE
jgi:hypothetical protein